MQSSTIRRYNLPTCTLEIGTQTASILSWLIPRKLEKIYFELYFNDPKLSEKERVIISGDREKLQQLSVAVNNYIQQFLALTPNDLSSKAEKATNFNDIYTPSLKPKNVLAHQLFFGSLATEKSGKQIELSALQLFDLATALDKYSTDLMVIEQNVREKAKFPFPLKTSLAATSILIFGLSAIALRFFNPIVPETQTISSSPQTEAESDLETNKPFQVLPPSPPKNPPQPKPSLPTTKTPTLAKDSKILTIPEPPPQPKAIEPPKNITRSPQFSRQINPKLPSLPSLKQRDRISSQPFAIEPNSRKSELIKRKTFSLDPAAKNKSQKENNDKAILAEVNNSLKQKWQPKKDLNRDLEYRLIIDRNGSLDRVIPLGYPAKIYRDRTGIPLEGEAFVSKLSARDKLTIRVFLLRDGSVQTFLE